MISGICYFSEVDRLCYPYLEAIKSFLPVADEIIVVMNVLSDDTDRKKIEELNDPKIRIIKGIFSMDKLGWLSFGNMRTLGYQAAKGDIVFSFDADGIFHENDVENFKKECQYMLDNNIAYGFWMKHRFYTPTKCWRQCKHTGIFNKKMMGDKWDFYGEHMGCPNWGGLPKEWQRGKQFEVYLWGYEHLWDTWEIFKEKIKFHYLLEEKNVDLSKINEKEFFKNYIQHKKDKLTTGYEKNLIYHPKIIQDKLKNINETHFGFNMFEDKINEL